MVSGGWSAILRPLLLVLVVLAGLNAFVQSAADVVTPQFERDQPNAEALSSGPG